MKRKIELANYSEGEGRCECGCGFQLTDEIVFALQAFIYILSRIFKTKIRHVITGGSRCKKHNADEGGAEDSQHIAGGATDGTFQQLVKGRWVQIPNNRVAEYAIQSKLFGGVGYKAYPKLGRNLVHLDVRPGKIAIW